MTGCVCENPESMRERSTCRYCGAPIHRPLDLPWEHCSIPPSPVYRAWCRRTVAAPAEEVES